MRKNMTFDASNREIDPENGYMRVSGCVLSRESVDPYYGYEIPNFLELGLDADEIYYVYRPAEELEAAVPSFMGVPLLIGHVEDSADDPQKDRRSGAVMNDLVMQDGDMIGTISVQDAGAIAGIENGDRVCLSSAYSYIPVMETGEWQGIPYSIRMTNIHGNHVALVEEGRVKGAMVADEKPRKKGKVMDIIDKLKRLLDEGDVQEDETPMEKREETAAEEFGITDPEKQREYAELDADQDKFLAELIKLTNGANDNEESKASLIRDVAELLENMIGEDKARDDEEILEERREKILAGDSKRKRHKAVVAMDMERVARTAKDAAMQEMRAIHAAVREVRPIIGDVDPFSISSPEIVYKRALEAQGIKASQYPSAAWQGMVHAISAKAQTALSLDWDIDSVSIEKDHKFPDNINVKVRG